MSRSPKTTAAPAAFSESTTPDTKTGKPSAAVDYFAPIRARRDALAVELLEPGGATAIRVLSEIDGALASADSALSLLEFETRRQRDVAARRAQAEAKAAADKRAAAALAHVQKLQAAARKKAELDALAAEAEKMGIKP